eukprot:scaffold660170_cov34-Prasinocladus_malaysianus.AAC.1
MSDSQTVCLKKGFAGHDTSGVIGSPSGRGMFMSEGVSSEPKMAASRGLRICVLDALSMAAGPDSSVVG